MARLYEWVYESVDGEQVEAVIFGELDSWLVEEKPKPPIGKVLKWHEALPYMQYSFSDGYGSADCHPILVYTKSWVIGIGCYDGSTFPFRLPRDPKNGFLPHHIGGG